MTRVAIGIHLDSEPDRLAATLAQLRAATAETAEIVLLPDGPDAAMRQLLESLDGLRQFSTDRPMGAAAAFNRLLRHAGADVMILLEAGALVGPGWLGRLLAALEADARNGLAGPSTNRSWNMQAAFPAAREAEIGRIAALAAARFGEGWRTMEPLYCLADFCYAVRREVAETIGGADEAYGAGPCWEMDYSVRAARAGFRAVWAQSAFVYRRPFAPRRRQSEARLFETNKRRYQDKFCGLRLIGARTAYANHCRGDACSHFAPADRIERRLPLGPAAPPAAPLAGEPVLAAAAVLAPAAKPAPPLVSCIMPTRNRRDWMLQAIAYFQRQDYPERELIIIDDSDVDCCGDVPADPRIRYVHSTKRLSIGAKRNHAAALSQGAVIAQWDDDDWYAAGRLSAQVAPILAGNADITALSHPRIFDLDRWEFWACAEELHRRLFVRDVHGGTLVYRRHVFERLARYPDASLAEDAVYLNAAAARGARLHAIPAADLFFYVRHGSNAWAFTCGQYLGARGWQRTEEPDALATDRGFYAARSRAAAARRPALADSKPTAHPGPALTTAEAPTPLVSCIMPTYNRRPFVAKAIEYFLRQDYPNRELIILDDGDDGVGDLVPDLPSLRYTALPERLRLGAKRNAAIEASRGEIIVHWDDDDWMDPGRIAAQVAALQSAGADICGTSRVWFCEIASGRLSLYQYPPTQRRWLYGASLCYRRSLWRQKPFEPLDIGEDTRFVWASPAGQMVDLAGSRLIVAMVHGGNTSRPQPLRGPNWASADDTAPGVLGEDWPFYAALSQQAAGRALANP